jgi:hypothetical protein
MSSRRKLGLVFGFCLLIGLGLVAVQALRSTRGGRDWLWVSKPVFFYCTNAERVQPIIWFVVSKTGPSSIGFFVAWSECRTHSDLSRVRAKLARPGKASRAIPLGAGSATNVVLNVDEHATNAELLFCCQVSWVEGESSLRRWGRQLDKPMYWLGAVLGFNWSSPWQQKSFASGDVFTSNLDVADYFSRVYGFTRKRWLEEQRLEQKRQAELTRIQASLPSGHGVGHFYGRTEPLTDREEVEIEAKAAFARFCAISTNEVAETEPGGAENGTQPIRPETNGTSAAAGSGR